MAVVGSRAVMGEIVFFDVDSEAGEVNPLRVGVIFGRVDERDEWGPVGL